MCILLGVMEAQSEPITADAVTLTSFWKVKTIDGLIYDAERPLLTPQFKPTTQDIGIILQNAIVFLTPETPFYVFEQKNILEKLKMEKRIEGKCKNAKGTIYNFILIYIEDRVMQLIVTHSLYGDGYLYNFIE